MKRIFFACVMCTLLSLCAATVWSADARHAEFMKAARNFVEHHILPDGEHLRKEELIGNFSDNQLALCDVDGNGKAELLVRFQSGTEASKQELVCGYDERSGNLTIEFMGTPGVEYFTNGCLKQKLSHNQGLGGEFWPYNFLIFDASQGEYSTKGSVDAWSRKAFPVNPFENDKPFPKDVDVTGDGFVYFIDDESFPGAGGFDKPVDTPVYKAWVKQYIGDAKKITVEWVPANASGLNLLEKK
ncbi:MAG: hypothetical protein K5657_09375 [Desulfovibrio sp.]|nr:hypothetical protein [Desulfovibrio sp.]